MAFDFLAGEGSGELAAQEFLNKRQQDRATTDRLNSQQYNSELMTQAQLKSNAFNLEKQQFEFEQERKKVKEDAITNGLAKQAFESNKPARKSADQIDSDTDIANQLQAAGSAIMGLDPKKALEYFDQSSKFKRYSTQKANDELDIKTKKAALAGDIASGVTDEESAKSAALELAKLGIPVPAKFTEWNPETQAFWENRATFSKNYVAKIKIQNDLLKTQAVAEDTQSKIKAREATQKLNEQKETRMQANLELARTQYKPSKEEFKEVKREAELLATSDDKFNNLPDEKLQEAAKDVRYLAQSIMVTEGITDRGVALAKARRQIKDRITPEGDYGVVDTGAKPAATKFVNGHEYVDANGNRAKYNNGNWEPIK